MMFGLILVFILLLVSIGLGIQLQKDPGYLYIAANHWSIETTLWVAVITMIAAFLTLHVLFNTLSWMATLPSSWRRRLKKRRAIQAQKKTRQGLIEFSEGHWQQAQQYLIKALPNTEIPLLNYLTAARAAQELGNHKLRDDYLREAQQSMPEAKIAVELTQAQLQLANRQWEQALATLKHLQSLAPNHPYVLKLLMNLYQEVNDWPQLLNLLPELRKNQVVSDLAYQQLQQRTYLQVLSDLIKQNQSETLKATMDSLPKSLALNPEIIAAYSRYLIDTQNYPSAETLLRRGLRKQFNETLIDLYGQIKSKDAQLSFVESLRHSHPDSAALFLSLGRLSCAENLWGKAKTYFEKSIELDPTPKAYLALGQLCEHLNDHSGAQKAYQNGLISCCKCSNVL